MIAIKGGTVVTVTNGIIDHGIVLVEGTKIAAVGGSDLIIPPDAEIIDAGGKWVTPGFIDAHTHISTSGEPKTLPNFPGQFDINEISDPVTPHLRAIDALNPHDIALVNARKGGFTTAYTLPGSGNVIGGTGIAFKTKTGASVYDIVLPGTEQMKMALGENPKRIYGSDKKKPVTRMGIASLLRESLYNAKVYSEDLRRAEINPEKTPKPDFKLDALLPVIRNEIICRIHAHRSDDIVTAIRIAKEFGLKKISIEHCTEGYKVAALLKENNITAVLGPMPSNFGKMEVWESRLNTPAVLEKAGVDICFTQDAASGTRYLPATIGYFIARGLSETGAFEGVSIRPARLLGIADRVGSLEAGKDADISIFSSFPFSSLSLCEKTIVDGVVYNNLDDAY
ncbi:MAG: amidohydrolase family protein [Treponema sp.]|jgi:imidazolonepropionase-like amidohydrolase|nr:amidohydrolase family protein [Treponema sp.]